MTTLDFDIHRHVALLCSSYTHWTGLHLIPPAISAEDAVSELMAGPYAVVSHDTAADPIFNYANYCALELFEMDSASFTRLPSRLSAEAVNQEKRGKALDEVAKHGFVQGYSGVRIASSGRKFLIRDTTIWNLVDAQGVFHGQAALIGATSEF